MCPDSSCFKMQAIAPYIPGNTTQPQARAQAANYTKAKMKPLLTEYQINYYAKVKIQNTVPCMYVDQCIVSSFFLRTYIFPFVVYLNPTSSVSSVTVIVSLLLVTILNMSMSEYTADVLSVKQHKLAYTSGIK